MSSKPTPSTTTAATTSNTSKTDFKKLSTAKKIESPLAKYNGDKLICIVCNQVVKSELVWNAHVNSKLHFENKNKLKSKLQAPSSNTSTSGNNDSSSEDTQARPESPTFKRPAQPLPLSTNKQFLNQLIDDDDKNDIVVETKKRKIENLVQAADSINLNKTQDESVSFQILYHAFYIFCPKYNRIVFFNKLASKLTDQVPQSFKSSLESNGNMNI